MDNPTHADIPVELLDAERHAVTAALIHSDALSEQSLPRVVELADRFCVFAARACDTRSLREVTTAEALSFIEAPTALGDPAPATMHLRRSSLRLLFRTARALGLADSDPTLDLVLPPRSQLKTRPLTDDEIAVCRAASLHTLTSTRLSAAWALAETSARSSELGHISARDVDPEARRVWLHGSSKVEARWAPLNDWGVTQLERRLATCGDEPERPVLYDGARGSCYHRQAASCVAVKDTLHRAGLGQERDVRPLSVVAWAGHRVLDETGRIEVVARRLGIRSLDRAAALIGFDWRDGEKAGGW